MSGVELRAEQGRAVLVGAPVLFQLPAALAGALDEWAEVAAAVRVEAESGDDGCDDAALGAVELVSARGRQLAVRLAAAAGMPVVYVDPVDGQSQLVDAEPAREPAAPAPATEPTPWATGLTLSGFVAAVVVITVVSLVGGLADVAWWLGAIGLVIVTGGLAPSVWLARQVPLWRWLSLGVAGGLALSWVVVLMSTLGP